MQNQQVGAMGVSAPPLAFRDGAGAINREHTPRRRRLDIEGPGRSPLAKRPAVYQAPLRSLPGSITEMNNRALTDEVAHHREVIEAMHTWVLSIEQSVDDHALHITKIGDGNRRNEQTMLELNAQLPRQHAQAETMIESAFKKTDEILAELRGADAALQAACGGCKSRCLHQISTTAQVAGRKVAGHPGLETSDFPTVDFQKAERVLVL